MSPSTFSVKFTGIDLHNTEKTEALKGRSHQEVEAIKEEKRCRVDLVGSHTVNDLPGHMKGTHHNKQKP